MVNRPVLQLAAGPWSVWAGGAAHRAGRSL